MLRVFSIKWMIGAVFFLLIFAVGCIWYYQYTTAPYQQEAEKAEKLLQQWEADTAKDPTPAAATASPQAPAESTTETAEKPTTRIGEEKMETDTEKTSKTVTIATPETGNTEEVRVSPHGFGPYPEVPEDFPENVDWSSYENDRPIFELMLRVQIKLWKQGHRTEGITSSSENELLYPISRGIVYINWLGSGDDKYAGGITGHPKDLSADVIEQIQSGTIPAGLTVLDRDKTGIDPYKFLNIQ